MIRSITSQSPLKVLGFTDTHLDDNPGCFRMTMKLMKEAVETEKPDMVVFVGDNVTGGDNLARVREFVRLMTELNVPWAPAIGNHEGDNPLSVTRREMIRMFMGSPSCMIPSVTASLPDGSKAWGVANYSVPLYNDSGKTCHRFVFLDGGSDMSRADMIKFGWGAREKLFDDYIKESQIKWYRQEIGADTCPSTVFCHVPIPEYREAMEYGEHISGSNLENVCCCPHNSGMFAAMLEEGKTKTFVAGHDHVNDAHYMYKGIRLIYNRMSGLSSYNMISTRRSDKLKQGCSVYYVHADSSMTFDDILYEDRYPMYRDDILAVIRTPDKHSS